jgi:hypothetical protein
VDGGGAVWRGGCVSSKCIGLKRLDLEKKWDISKKKKKKKKKKKRKRECDRLAD